MARNSPSRFEGTQSHRNPYAAVLSDSVVEAGAFIMRWRALCKWIHSSHIRVDCNVWIGANDFREIQIDHSR